MRLDGDVDRAVAVAANGKRYAWNLLGIVLFGSFQGVLHDGKKVVLANFPVKTALHISFILSEDILYPCIQFRIELINWPPHFSGPWLTVFVEPIDTAGPAALRRRRGVERSVVFPEDTRAKLLKCRAACRCVQNLTLSTSLRLLGQHTVDQHSSTRQQTHYAAKVAHIQLQGRGGGVKLRRVHLSSGLRAPPIIHQHRVGHFIVLQCAHSRGGVGGHPPLPQAHRPTQRLLKAHRPKAERRCAIKGRLSRLRRWRRLGQVQRRGRGVGCGNCGVCLCWHSRATRRDRRSGRGGRSARDERRREQVDVGEGLD
mmetsp:Transcript_253/g.609  ORF Transcript_253/g.609 Transcript_253/m.609 type:complete len:313 (+) Transcript_253:1322-2260(+)